MTNNMCNNFENVYRIFHDGIGGHVGTRDVQKNTSSGVGQISYAPSVPHRRLVRANYGQRQHGRGSREGG